MELTGVGGEAAAWWGELTPFDALHALTVLGWGLLTLGVVMAGRRAAGSSEAAGRRAAIAFGCVCLVVYVFNTVYWLTPGELDMGTSLPLHVCDITLMLVPWMFFLRSRALVALMWLWGAGVSSWGLVLPVETAGPEAARYWVFWTGHGAVVTGGIYGVVVLGFRPGWRDLRFAGGVGVAYAVVMMLVNSLSALERGEAGGWVLVASGAWNYGYVGPFEDPPAFGGLGWFWRSLVMLGCALVAMVVLTVPFWVAGWCRGVAERRAGLMG